MKGLERYFLFLSAILILLCITSCKDKDELFNAARYGDMRNLRFQVEKGANLDPQDINGLTPLDHAIEMGNMKVVQNLVEHGANVNDDGRPRSIPLKINDWWNRREKHYSRILTYDTPLHVAVKNGREEVAAYLIEKGANVNAVNRNGATVLTTSIRKGNAPIVKLLIESGADCSNPKLAHYAFQEKEIEIVWLLREKIGGKEFDQNLMLADAIFSESAEGVDFVLNQGVNPNKPGQKGRHPMHQVKTKCFAVYDTLAKHGADVNALDKDGRTALHRVAKDGWQESAKVLIQNGADVNRADAKGRTPLFYTFDQSGMVVVPAAENLKMGTIQVTDAGGDKVAVDVDALVNAFEKLQGKKGTVLDILLKNGAKVDIKDQNGDTALHFAARYGSIEAARLLIRAGADPNVKNKNDGTPITIAEGRQNKEMICLLKNNKSSGS